MDNNVYIEYWFMIHSFIKVNTYSNMTVLYDKRTSVFTFHMGSSRQLLHLPNITNQYFWMTSLRCRYHPKWCSEKYHKKTTN